MFLTRTLSAICAALLLASCHVSDAQMSEKRRRLVAGDDTYRGVEITGSAVLDVRDKVTGRPIDELIIYGSARGLLKDRYFVDDKPIPLSCYLAPFSCYSEKGMSPETGGPTIAALAKRAAGIGDLTYRFDGADTFRYSENFTELTKHRHWTGSVLANGYCKSNAADAIEYLELESGRIRRPARSYATQLTPFTGSGVNRVRYIAKQMSEIHLDQTLNRASHLPHVYKKALDWAAPLTDNPLDNAVYVSLLWKAAEVNHAPDDSIRVNLLEREISQHLAAAREIYYAYDDWRIAPASVEIRWMGDDAKPIEPQCVRLNSALRIPRLSARDIAFPLLPARTDLRASSNSLQTGSARDIAVALALKPYPFCVSAGDAIINLQNSAGSESQPIAIQRPTQSIVVQSRQGGSKVAEGLYGAGPVKAKQVLTAPYRVVCRHGAPNRCDLDKVDGLGDTPLITLSRANSSYGGQYPFALPTSILIGKQSAEGYTRNDAAKFVQLLLKAGAAPTAINPALDVNALEVALDALIYRARSKNFYKEYEAMKPEIAIVEILLSEFERLNGELREDYSSLVREVSQATVVATPGGTEPAWLLSAETTQRLLKLPKRGYPMVCGSGLGWFQQPANLGSTITPLRFGGY